MHHETGRQSAPLPPVEGQLMKYLDDLIVAIAKTLIRAAFAVTTAWVYVQFVGLALIASAVGTVAIFALVALAKTAIFGA